jgi:hypothetical protein
MRSREAIILAGQGAFPFVALQLRHRPSFTAVAPWPFQTIFTFAKWLAFLRRCVPSMQGHRFSSFLNPDPDDHLLHQFNSLLFRLFIE